MRQGGSLDTGNYGTSDLDAEQLDDDDDWGYQDQDQVPRHELHEILVPDDYLSRGTGEEIPLGDTCVYDFMPPILGALFMQMPALREQAYFMGESCGPFLDTERAYGMAAEESLKIRDLSGALIAYKGSMYAAMIFTRSMRELDSIIVLSQDELDVIGAEHFASLERQLIDLAEKLEMDEPIDPGEYRAFVREVAADEKRSMELHREWDKGFDSRNQPIAGGPDPGVMQEYINLQAKMGRFRGGLRILQDLWAGMTRLHITRTSYPECRIRRTLWIKPRRR